jgi:DNA-binding winged helix-turn-helix (wHTH) protein/tetratricopeptide (TPR) repeat protein
LLFLLAQRPGELVTREEILKRIWGKDVFLETDKSINTAVWKIRHALRDDAEAPRFVVMVPAKGYRFVAPLREASQATSHRDGENAVRPPQGPMVGRERELVELRVGLADASAGRGRLFLVSGEPGIGKTRLSAAIASMAQAEGMAVLVGHCLDYQEAVPYLPFVEILESLIDQTASAETLRSRLGDEASELALLIPRLKRILPELRGSPDLSPEQARRQLFTSVYDFLARLAREQAVLIVLEDLHWADDAALSLFDHIAQRLSDVPLLIIGTHRDAPQDVTPALAKSLENLSRGRLATTMRLKGLPPEEVAQLLNSLGRQEPPASVVSEICVETAGNPFYIEELLRYLAEENRLYDSAGQFRRALGFGELEAPPSVRLIVGRRLSKLSIGTQEILGAASIIGREFSVEVLRAMHGSPGLLECLEQAEGAGLVFQSTSIPTTHFEFAHELTRQAVLSRLSPLRREQLHLSAGQAIESTYEHNLDRHISTLATHYRLAGAAAAEKAIDYSIRAGEAAYAVFAYEEAATHWLVALQLMDKRGGNDPARRAHILSLLGDELISTGPKAVAHLEEASSIYDEMSDDQCAADIHARLGLYLSAPNLGARNVEKAMVHLQKAEALLTKLPVSRKHAYFYTAMAAACVWAHRINEGIEAGRRAMEIGDQTKNEVAWINGAIFTSLFLVFRGALAEGLDLANEARKRAAGMSNTMLGSTIAQIGGGNYHRLIDPREARNWYLDELSLPRTAQSEPRRALLRNLAALACVHMGQLAEARDHLVQAGGGAFKLLLVMEGEWDSARESKRESLELAQATGDRVQEMDDLFSIASLHRVRGEFGLAEELAGRGLAIAIEAGDVLSELWGSSLIAMILSAQGRATEAIAHLERCREILALGEDWRAIAGYVARAEAVVAAALRSYSTADRQFEKAITTFRRYTLPWEEAETLRLWGCALGSAGNHARSVEKCDVAIEIYRLRGAGARWIERAEAAKIPNRGRKAILKDVVTSNGGQSGKSRNRS